ncbi:hypothetical protein [Sporosarcina sp. P17b]|uniref:hypothetical protein n=1 Tax=Sporosarcina sp. P17b TaxID=2048260 RepID=UPI000C16E4FC|nr:hypothetical protein [Sporosarcina sp. P17b]PIC72511.1 hypothetical protein CSV76_14875 [Sporosarcina sp. P17b]
MSTETNVERLTEIINRWEHRRCIYLHDVEWLIGQAELARVLESDNNLLQAIRNGQGGMIRKLHEENARLRESLREVFELSKHDGHSHYLDKCYVVARQALEGEFE